MDKFKKMLTVAAAVAAAAAFTVTVQAASAGVVDTDSSPLSVRSLASTSSAKLTTLSKGSLVTLISKSGSWWYVEYGDGRYGYCHQDYISQLTSAKSAYVNISGGKLNVRASGSKSSSVIDALYKGESAVVLSEANGWSRILYDGVKTGYVYSAYLTEGEGTGATLQKISLSVADYKQYDGRWANMKVGSSGKTMRSIGCVTTALAATERYRLGDSSLTPATMLYRLSYTSSGDVLWPSNYRNYTSSGYLQKTYDLLKSGKPVIFGAKNSYGKMHWVVVTGYSGSGTDLKTADFMINDPGSETRVKLSDLFKEYPYFYKIEYYV
ncbi:MAG: SH3 domain-containing protein [Clostridia bacterium]|nr:SH3 domain-containing protein [Clostridia bacterium]